MNPGWIALRRGSALLGTVLLCAAFTSSGPEKGNRLFRAGHVQEAVDAYRQAIAEGGPTPELEYDLGTALLRLQRYDDAEQAFRAALSTVDPSLREWTYYNLGNRFLDTGRSDPDARAGATLLDAAARAYRQALRLTPEDSAAKWNLEMSLRERDKQKQRQQQQQNSPSSGQTPQSRQQPSGGGTGGGQQQSPTQPSSNGGSATSPMSREEAARLLNAIEQNERRLYQESLRKGHPPKQTLRNW
jgi:Ca-activated chloride channel homolog